MILKLQSIWDNNGCKKAHVYNEPKGKKEANKDNQLHDSVAALSIVGT